MGILGLTVGLIQGFTEFYQVSEGFSGRKVRVAALGDKGDGLGLWHVSGHQP